MKGIKIGLGKFRWYPRTTVVVIALLALFGVYFVADQRQSDPQRLDNQTRNDQREKEQQAQVTQTEQTTEIIQEQKKEETQTTQVTTQQNQEVNQNTQNQNKKTDVNNFQRDCGKETIIVYTGYPFSQKTMDEIRQYFAQNNLKIEAESGNEFIILSPDINRAFWISKIESDGIGDAQYDTVGCDFVKP